MILTILSYRLPGLPGTLHTALQALLWAVGLLATLALCVAVCVAVAPVLPQLAAAAFIVGGYAGLTYPRSKKVQP
jgi:hypothetical protein